MRRLLVILILLSASSLRAASTAATALENEYNALQTKLRASNEEWGVIFPRLLQIRTLREEVSAVASSSSSSAAASRRGRNGVMGSPMGGTSLDTPIMPGGNGPRRGFVGGSLPFDPNTAPGHTNPPSTLLKLLGVDTAQTRRAVARRFASSQGNSVEALLSELQTLVSTEGTTTAQIMDKLAAIRAARAKAARDLKRAQDELAPLLTLSQYAVLVSLGYLD